jgi:CheY-like chemotaxis protein
VGIPKHLHDRLFTPYAQGDPSVPRLYGGSGLGLSICRRLVGLMGGDIALVSQPGQGATFEVSLVLAKGSDGRAALASSTAGIAGTRLLIVDPNATTGALMQQHAASWGLETRMVGSGGEALAGLGAARRDGREYDVALIDPAIPDMGGEELGRRIKADPELRATQLVMVTSSGAAGRRRAREPDRLCRLSPQAGHRHHAPRLPASAARPGCRGGWSFRSSPRLAAGFRRLRLLNLHIEIHTGIGYTPPPCPANAALAPAPAQVA